MAIRIEGAAELIARLERIQQLRKVKASMKMAGYLLAGKMKEYPPQAHIPNPLIKSNERVRKGFFARLRKGEIGVPYSRTRKLGNSWTVRTRNSGLTAIIGNNTSYGQLVQSPEGQTRAHRQAGWITTAKAEETYRSEIVDYIRNALIQEVEG